MDNTLALITAASRALLLPNINDLLALTSVPSKGIRKTDRIWLMLSNTKLSSSFGCFSFSEKILKDDSQFIFYVKIQPSPFLNLNLYLHYLWMHPHKFDLTEVLEDFQHFCYLIPRKNSTDRQTSSKQPANIDRQYRKI